MSLKKDFLSGVFYSALAKYSGILISLVVASILARLLTPEEFGVVGVATVLIAFVNILGDIGIGPAVIQNNTLTENDLKSIHAFTTYLGLLLGALFFFSAPVIANIYEDGALIEICQWFSLSIVFTCWGIVPLNINYKNKKFKKIAVITLVVQIISGFAACIYAIYDGGVYALILQFVSSSVLLSIIYNFSIKLSWRLYISKDSLKKIISFSTYQFMFNLINFFSRNSDKLLIGKYIGLTQLGYYEKSYRLMMLPLQNITFVITPVLLPIFSTLQNDVKELGEKYLKLVVPLSYLAFPISVILYFCSPELILIIFGEQWKLSIMPLQILSLSVGFQILIATTGGVFQSMGETKRMFQSGLWGAIFIISSFIITIYCWKTIVAVSIGYLLAQVANVIQCFYSLFLALQLKPLIFFRKIIRPIAISIVLFVFMLLQFNYIQIHSIWMSLITKLFTGLAISSLLTNWLSPYNLYKILIKSKTIL